ncbi:MAG: Gfo/Idh/MocA family oxidoreductase, partial [Phycisphaerales bacterium]
MINRRRFTRRIFLRRTAGVVGAAAAATAVGFPYVVRASALGLVQSVRASNRITIGFIGTGSHGRGVNLRNFLGNADAQAVAVCDVDRNNMNIAREMVNNKYGNKDCATYRDFRDVLARDDIDAVMISTPDHWHVPISIMAA